MAKWNVKEKCSCQPNLGEVCSICHPPANTRIVRNNTETILNKILQEEEKYRGVTSQEYKDTVLNYSNAMFDLFDKDKKYNSNLGMHLMWLGSWTSRYIGREVVDYSIDNLVSLNDALIEILKINCGGTGKTDLDKIKLLLTVKHCKCNAVVI